MMVIETNNEAVARLIPKLEALNAGEIAEIEEHLDVLQNGTDEDDWDPEFIAEINRRVADIEAGRVETIPADIVHQELREMIKCESLPTIR